MREEEPLPRHGRLHLGHDVRRVRASHRGQPVRQAGRAVRARLAREPAVVREVRPGSDHGGADPGGDLRAGFRRESGGARGGAGGRGGGGGGEADGGGDDVRVVCGERRGGAEGARRGDGGEGEFGTGHRRVICCSYG